MRKFSISIFFILSVFLFGYPKAIQAIKPGINPQATSMFRSVIPFTMPAISTPTIVEYNFDRLLTPYNIVVLQNSTFLPQPFTILSDYHSEPFTIWDRDENREFTAMSDNNQQTYSAFELSDDIPSTATVIIKYQKTQLVDVLRMLLTENVSRPRHVTIEYESADGNSWVTILNRAPFTSEQLSFPPTKAQNWRISFAYDQPLRITLLGLFSSNTYIGNYRLRFLARPNESYTAFYDPARTHSFTNELYNNYASEQNPLTIHGTLSQNANYEEPDNDLDGVLNTQDNCPEEPNQDQLDMNTNSIGDACEDFDKDGVFNAHDNCSDVPNSDQADVDGDGIGDKCDKEESRITEKYPWLPWMGIIYIGVMTAVLFFVTARQKKDTKESATKN